MDAFCLNPNQAQRLWGRWRETFWLLTNCELPASLTIGECYFSGNHFYCEHKQLFANDLELEQFDKTAQATLWASAKSVVDAFNLTTPDHIHFEGLRYLGGEREFYRLDGGACRSCAPSMQRSVTLGIEDIPSSEFIEKIASYRKHHGLGLMIESYGAAKSLSSNPRESLLLALRVLQIACWQEARKATPKAIEDKEVVVSPSILRGPMDRP